MFAGSLPWQPTNLAVHVTEDALKLAMYKAQSELSRTNGELVYLRHDVLVLLAYYKHQQHCILLRALELGEGGLNFSMAHLLRTKLQQVAQLHFSAKQRFSKAGLL